MKDPEDLTDKHTDNKPSNEKVRIGTVGGGAMGSRAILALAMLSSMRDFGIPDDEFGYRPRRSDSDEDEYESAKKKAEFTKEEEEKLKSLNGKEKKKFVKELKEKYKKGIEND